MIKIPGSNQVLVEDAKDATELGYAVKHRNKNTFLFPFVLVEDEQRVRLDVFDGLDNYVVCRIDHDNEKVIELDWDTSYT